MMVPGFKDDDLESYAASILNGHLNLRWFTSRYQKHPNAQQLFLKCVYANGLYEWLVDAFDIHPVILWRHPCGQARSITKVQQHFRKRVIQPDDHPYARQIFTEEEILAMREVLAFDDSYEARAIVQWFFDNEMIRRAYSRTVDDPSQAHTDIIWYEEFCLNPEHHLKELLVAVKYLTPMAELPVACKKYMRKTTSRETTSGFAVTRIPTKHCHAWMDDPKWCIASDNYSIVDSLASLFGWVDNLRMLESLRPVQGA